MAFYLPIAQLLTAERLDALIRQYDPLSADTPPLDFAVRGMLKGFIDLVFRHEGRYYLLDYKPTGWGRSRGSHPAGDGAGDAPTATIHSISCIARRCTAICATGWPIMTMTATSAA